MKKYVNGVNLLSILYTLLLLFGTSYFITGSAEVVFQYLIISIFLFILIFYLIKKTVLYLFHSLDKLQYEQVETGTFHRSGKFGRIGGLLEKGKALLEKHPFLFSLGLILLLWLPYILSFYPAILSPDPSFQIRQFFGIPNKYSDYAVMLDENVTITNHHPVLHTLLLGSCLKFGNMLGNDNLGLFLYTIIQILILSCVLAYTIKYMTDRKVPFKFRLGALLIYGLVPMFPFYAMSAVKDVIYSALLILYILMMYHFMKTHKKIKVTRWIAFLILILGILLFRNNGFYVLLLSFPFLFIRKLNRKRLILLFVCFVAFHFSYNNVILPYFKITPSSIREVLSIPFQQTARYVGENELSQDEYEIYDKILDMSDLAKRYDPELSDPVKNKFNKYTTKEELIEYFEYWGKGLLKDPGTYIEATINNVYGYFYPVPINWYLYYKFDDRIVDNGFDYHYNDFSTARNVLSGIGNAFVYIPIVGFVSNIGFNTWILFFLVTYLINRKKYKSIVYLTPALVTLLICVASPANAYFRYAMPYIFSMPVIIGLFVKEVDYEKRQDCSNSTLL